MGEFSVCGIVIRTLPPHRHRCRGWERKVGSFTRALSILIGEVAQHKQMLWNRFHKAYPCPLSRRELDRPLARLVEAAGTVTKRTFPGPSNSSTRVRISGLTSMRNPSQLHDTRLPLLKQISSCRSQFPG